jgi:hypothetical protein
MARDSTDNRLSDGQSLFSGGVDAGNLGHLINSDQCQFAINVTFRGGVPGNRPPYERKTVDFSAVTGKFQGALDGLYQADSGSTYFLFMVGGHLWRLNAQLDSSPQDITPKRNVVTSANFTVPSVNAQVTVDLNSLFGLVVGDDYYFGNGKYTVIQLFDTSAVLEYLSGDIVGNTVLNGTWVTDDAGNGLVEVLAMSVSADFAWIFQAENYAIVLCGENSPFIYDGSSTVVSVHDQIPPGFIGAYESGRIWLVQNNRRSYVAGDLIGPGGDYGTAEHGYRDAILWFTENTYLAEGGTFSTPAHSGRITAIGSPATTDAALGTGPVLIGTTKNIFSCNAPIDRTQWQLLTYPIQTIAARGYGPVGPRMFTPVNGDFWFRSPDGFRSFIIARRDFARGWQNTPKSDEVGPILSYDNEDLLLYGSSVNFDNRYLATCSPQLTTDYGVVHRGLYVLNFDEISKLNSQSEPAWEGLWTGVEIHQIIKGDTLDKERCFMFARGSDGSLELWEMLKDGLGDVFVDDGTISVTPITSSIEGHTLVFGSIDLRKELQYADVFVRDVRGETAFIIEFRPDDYPDWVAWDNWEECVGMTLCPLACPPAIPRKPGYRPRFRTKSAPDATLLNNFPAKLFYALNWRLSWSGKASPWRMRFTAGAKVDEPKDKPPELCNTYAVCDDSWFTYKSIPTT